MVGRKRDEEQHPLHIEHLVDTEHRAGTDLAWIVVFATVLCALAIAFAVLDAVRH